MQPKVKAYSQLDGSEEPHAMMGDSAPLNNAPAKAALRESRAAMPINAI